MSSATRSRLSWTKERLLWWRCFLPIIFAHKPLCTQFHHHTLRLHHVHICRSCTLLWLAIGMSSVYFYLNPDILISSKSLAACLLLVTIILSFPPLYRFYPRLIQDVCRFLLGVCMASVIWLLIYEQWQSGLLLGLCLWGARTVINIFRAIDIDKACRQCPEFTTTKICSGYQYKARRIRLYDRVLNRKMRACS